mmetsp:Transcript_15230/g.24252  ORF Transcript_15230/g.24252 Transcript_15230/m.24252 type:complete len:131 (+) Transcript_15230:1025-1417(+)
MTIEAPALRATPRCVSDAADLLPASLARAPRHPIAAEFTLDGTARMLDGTLAQLQLPTFDLNHLNPTPTQSPASTGRRAGGQPHPRWQTGRTGPIRQHVAKTTGSPLMGWKQLLATGFLSLHGQRQLLHT